MPPTWPCLQFLLCHPTFALRAIVGLHHRQPNHLITGKNKSEMNKEVCYKSIVQSGVKFCLQKMEMFVPSIININRFREEYHPERQFLLI